jgi:hypothetical protein
MKSWQSAFRGERNDAGDQRFQRRIVGHNETVKAAARDFSKAAVDFPRASHEDSQIEFKRAGRRSASHSVQLAAEADRIPK